MYLVGELSFRMRIVPFLILIIGPRTQDIRVPIYPKGSVVQWNHQSDCSIFIPWQLSIHLNSMVSQKHQFSISIPVWSSNKKRKTKTHLALTAIIGKVSISADMPAVIHNVWHCAYRIFFMKFQFSLDLKRCFNQLA